MTKVHFKPINKKIVVEIKKNKPQQKEEETSLVFVPQEEEREDTQHMDQPVECRILEAADDSVLKKSDFVIVEKSRIKEVEIDGHKFLVVSEAAVDGIIIRKK